MSAARRPLAIAGAAALGMAVLCGVGLLERGPFDPGLLVLGAAGHGLIAAAALGAGRWGGARVRRGVLFGVWVLLASEVLLQLLAAGRFIPGAAIREATPFGRVLWTHEGSRHGTLNRWGWHGARSDFSGGAPRVVIVGDSFIEGLEVAPEENLGVRLERRLGEAEVITLGRGATGPGHYLETARYALARHGPDHVIVSFFLGNDFTDSWGQGPVEDQLEHELLYGIDARGDVTLHAATAIAPATYRFRLEYNHSLTPLTLARTLLSHHIGLGLARDLWGRRRAMLATPPDFQPTDTLPEMRVGEGEALRLAVALLAATRDDVEAAGARFSVVTIPHFPEALYAQDPAAIPDLSRYGPLADEQALVAALERARIDALPLGRRLVRERHSVAEIGALYIDGVGHLTPEGHGWVASAMCAELFEACEDPIP